MVTGQSLASAGRQQRQSSGPRRFGPFRVLHVINGEHYSGAERVQDLLALRLPEFGVEVGIACVKPDQFPALRSARRVPLYETPMRRPFDLSSAARSVAALVRGRGYQLIHAHTPRTALVGRIASQLTGVPLIYHVHSPTSRDSTRWLRNRINQMVERWSVRTAVRLITVSRSLQDDIVGQGVEPDRVRFIANGVPSSDRPWRRDRPWGVWRLGCVALFRPRKGTETLLVAMARLRARGVAVTLDAVGRFESASYEREVKQLAARLGLARSICWRGFTRDVDRELVRMDLLILPSLFGEGLPMVVLEAMAAGVPVVATRVEGVPEAIRDRVDGVLVAPGSGPDLAAGIDSIVSGQVDWARLACSARQRHARHFSDTAMAAQVAAVYAEVLDCR